MTLYNSPDSSNDNLLGAIVQITVFKMQGKKNWWFGIIIATLMIVATIFNWININ